MADIVLKSIGNIESRNAIETINSNFQAIARVLKLHLDRSGGDGSNAMLDRLDMNDRRIINLPTPTDPHQPATKGYVDSLFTGEGDVSFLTDGDIGVTVQSFNEAGAVEETRTISAGTGLVGGGDLSEDRTISIDKASAGNVASNTSTAQTIIGPSGIQAGDLLVLYDLAYSTVAPSTAVPTGFNIISSRTWRNYLSKSPAEEPEVP